jgi:hypothetical protein
MNREVLIHSRLHGPLSVSRERHTDSTQLLVHVVPRMRGPGATGAELVPPVPAFGGHDKKDVGTTH